MRQARQGDVLVTATDDEATGKPVPIESGRVVLAHGEFTGHAHALPATDCELVDDAGIVTLTVRTSTALGHEEHAPVPLDPGRYRVTRQREYRYGQARRVED